jgi:hypothetical protein
MENKLADIERGKTLDLPFGAFALRYVRQEIEHVEDQCRATLFVPPLFLYSRHILLVFELLLVQRFLPKLSLGFHESRMTMKGT